MKNILKFFILSSPLFIINVEASFLSKKLPLIGKSIIGSRIPLYPTQTRKICLTNEQRLQSIRNQIQYTALQIKEAQLKNNYAHESVALQSHPAVSPLSLEQQIELEGKTLHKLKAELDRIMYPKKST